MDISRYIETSRFRLEAPSLYPFTLELSTLFSETWAGKIPLEQLFSTLSEIHTYLLGKDADQEVYQFIQTFIELCQEFPEEGQTLRILEDTIHAWTVSKPPKSKDSDQLFFIKPIKY